MGSRFEPVCSAKILTSFLFFRLSRSQQHHDYQHVRSNSSTARNEGSSLIVLCRRYFLVCFFSRRPSLSRDASEHSMFNILSNTVLQSLKMTELDHTAPPPPEPARPILASDMLAVEEKQRARFAASGERIGVRCGEIDDYLLEGGFERGIVVGISAEGEEGQLVS
jgi:hypothetical protein